MIGRVAAALFLVPFAAMLHMDAHARLERATLEALLNFCGAPIGFDLLLRKRAA